MGIAALDHCNKKYFTLSRSKTQFKRAVTKPEAIDHALNEFERPLGESLFDLSRQVSGMQHRSEQIQQELRNLTTTVASCGPSPALVEAINEREQELRTITGRLLASETDSVSAQVAQIRGFVTERLSNLRGLLYADVQRARTELAKHVSGIKMFPHLARDKGHYVASGEWNLLGGYLEEGVNNDDAERVRLVAGGGFEPPTFGL